MTVCSDPPTNQPTNSCWTRWNHPSLCLLYKCVCVCVCVTLSAAGLSVGVCGAQVTHSPAPAQDCVSLFGSREQQHGGKAQGATIYRSLLAYLATGRRWRQGKELWRPRRDKIEHPTGTKSLLLLLDTHTLFLSLRVWKFLLWIINDSLPQRCLLLLLSQSQSQ